MILLGENMDMRNKVKKILNGVKFRNSSEMTRLTLLALCELRPTNSFSDAKNNTHTTRDVMDYMNNVYGKYYAPNTRETLRKDVLKIFVLEGLVETNKDNPKRPTNSGNFCYSITDEFLELIKTCDTETWDENLEMFNKTKQSIADKYSKIRESYKVGIKINGEEISFSPGKHNELQKLIIEQFLPIFAPGSELAYVGDTANKSLHMDQELLNEIGLDFSSLDKLPDVVAYLREKDWIFFVEAVTSVGPFNQNRIMF